MWCKGVTVICITLWAISCSNIHQGKRAELIPETPTDPEWEPPDYKPADFWEPVEPTVSREKPPLRLCTLRTSVRLPNQERIDKVTLYALKEWNMWLGQELFTPRLPHELANTEEHNYISIRYATKWEMEEMGPRSLGKSSLEIHPEDHCVRGGRLVVNPRQAEKPSIYLRNVILHQLGHMIGLDYVYDEKHVMSYRLGTRVGKDLLPIHPKSVNRLYQLYGLGGKE